MTYDLQKPQPTVIRTPVSEVVDAVRLEGLSLREAVNRSGRSREQMKALCWRAAKTDTFVRDGYRCVQCGHAAIDPHHRLPRQAGSTSRPLILYGLANLVSLCRDCHTWTEVTGRETGWAYDKGYLIHQGGEPTEVPLLHLWHGWVLLDNAGGVTPCPPPTDEQDAA